MSAARTWSDDDDDDDGIIGPALPPNLLKGKTVSRRGDDHDEDGNSGSDEIGPALPPHLRQGNAGRDSTNEEHARRSSRSGDCGGDIGPALPPHLLNRTKDDAGDDDEGESFGVQLPPDYSRWNKYDVDTSGSGDDDDKDIAASRNTICANKVDESDSDDDAYGPALPPGFQKKNTTPSQSADCEDQRTASFVRDSYGPSLPPTFQRDSFPTSSAREDDVARDEDDDDDDDEDDMIGPMPMKPGMEGKYARSAAEEFEKRSLAMRQKLSQKDDASQPQRESWMTELPGYSTTFGLGARTFRKTPVPEAGDRSVWTDTPADRARKDKERAEKRQNEERRGKKSKQREETELTERDKRLATMVAKHNEAARGESLVDMHSKKRKKEMEEEKDKPKERRPFDRDIDLKANQFDDAQRKLMIKKSAQLNDRFSHSKEKMFL